MTRPKGSDEGECRCAELEARAIRSLEANVDEKDRGAREYQTTLRVAQMACPVHGSATGKAKS